MLLIKKIVLLLEALAAADQGLGMSELSRHTELPGPTVYRIVNELAKYGLIVKDSVSKKYQLGWKLVELSAGLLEKEREKRFVPLVEPYLKNLAERFGETVFFTVFKDNAAVCLAKVDGRRGLRYYVEVGKRMPFNSCASAKAVLAYQPDAIKEKILWSTKWEAFTPKTIVDSSVLREHLEAVKKQGYAVCDNELETGVNGLAVPVFTPQHDLLGSITVIGPRERLKEPFISVVREALLATSAEITAQLLHGLGSAT